MCECVCMDIWCVCVGARVTEIFWAIMLIRIKHLYLHVLYMKM